MKIKIQLHTPLYYMLILMPFIDMITGYAFNMNVGGVITYVGQIYRIIMLLYLPYTIFLQKTRTKHIWLILFTAYLVGLLYLNHYRFQSSIVENFSYTLKLILPIYMIYGLISVSQGRVLIQKVLNCYSWIYPLSLVIPKLLGIGYYISNYAFDSGYKGFYYANNELNVILMVLFVYCFDMLYNDIISYRKEIGVIGLNSSNVVKLFLTIFSLILIGSKTSIIAILIVCIAYLLKRENIRYKIKYLIVFFGSAIISMGFVFVILNTQINNMILRLIYSYNRYIGGGFLTFLLSKRNLRIEPGIEYWYKNHNQGLLNLLFGIGKDAKCPNDGISSNPFALIELDLFDCLFWFGIIVTVIMIVFYLSFYFYSIKTKGLFREKVVFILVFSFSMIAGHVMMSANSGTIFALVTADLYLKSKDLKISKIKTNT